MPLSYQMNYVHQQTNTQAIYTSWIFLQRLYWKKCYTIKYCYCYTTKLELKRNYPLVYQVKSLFPIGKIFFLHRHKSYKIYCITKTKRMQKLSLVNLKSFWNKYFVLFNRRNLTFVNLSQKLDTISLRSMMKKENSLLDAIQRYLLIYASIYNCITNRRHSRKKRFEISDMQSSVTNTESVNKRLEGT